MIGAAIFGAEQMKYAGLARLEPDLLGRARHHIVLDAKRRDEKRMDHVLRRHDQADRAAERECAVR